MYSKLVGYYREIRSIVSFIEEHSLQHKFLRVLNADDDASAITIHVKQLDKIIDDLQVTWPTRSEKQASITDVMRRLL